MFISLHLLCRLEFAGWRFFTFPADGVEETQTALLWKNSLIFDREGKINAKVSSPFPVQQGLSILKGDGTHLNSSLFPREI